jgi:hypothetical protein
MPQDDSSPGHAIPPTVASQPASRGGPLPRYDRTCMWGVRPPATVGGRRRSQPHLADNRKRALNRPQKSRPYAAQGEASEDTPAAIP